MSAMGGNTEEICSDRDFLSLTQRGPLGGPLSGAQPRVSDTGWIKRNLGVHVRRRLEWA